MMVFNELMQAKDFSAEVNMLCSDFRKRFALPPIHQLGLVVPDVERASRELEDKNIGPFLIGGGSVDFWDERGEQKPFSGKLGLAYHQGFELELLEPGIGSDFYKSCVDRGGRAVLQHLGFIVRDVDIWASILSQAGYPVWVKGELSVWPVRTRFAYMDTVKDTGFVIEFISWSLFGLSFRPPAGLVHTVGSVQKRIGVRSLNFK